MAQNATGVRHVSSEISCISMSSSDGLHSAALGPEEFLEHLRAASRRLLRGDAASDLRCSCDEWTIGGGRIDPIEPLTNRGRPTITWPHDAWSSISTDLLGALDRSANDGTDALPAALAEYAAFVHLEFAAAHDPPLGSRAEAFVLPLVIASREGASSTEFRRYALGWRARAGSLPWNAPEMDRAASLAVALGSTGDAVIGESVTRIRAVLDEEKRSGGPCFGDLVGSDARELWIRAASASAPDAAAWARDFMR
jgi:hypothetical protein